jgi:ATP-dependent protease ClpP protease subunit
MQFEVFGEIDEYLLVQLKQALESKPEAIEFEICSGGGAIFVALAMIDACIMSGVHMTAKIYGLAASAAATLALACERVEMTSNGTMLLHSAWSPDDNADEGIKVCNARQLAIIQRRDPAYTMENLLQETFFDANACKAHGFCDNIIQDSGVGRIVALLCDKLTIKSGGVTMAENGVKTADLKAACSDGERKEEMRAEEPMTENNGGDKTAVDVMEKMLERLEQIEHRLAVLEGEGKKDDDEMEDITSGDALAARYNKLYAKLARAPMPCPAPVVSSKQSEVSRAKASFDKYKQQINLNDFLN